MLFQKNIDTLNFKVDDGEKKAYCALSD